MPQEQYKEDTLKALTRTNLGIVDYRYRVTKKGGGAQMELTWKKHILTNNVKFLLGSVTLNISQEQGPIRLLDFAVSELEENQQEVGNLQKENHRLASEWQGALTRLDKCANLQEDIEKDLLSKFKGVLNEKKAKIRRLMEQLNNTTAQLSQLTQSVKQSASKPAAPPITDGSGTERQGEGQAKYAQSTPPPSPPPSPGGLGLPRMYFEKKISSPPVKRRKRNIGASKFEDKPAVMSPSIRSSSSAEEESIDSDALLQLM